MKQISEIKESVARRGKEYGADRIYLFGSYARGDANENSDVDLRIDRGQIKGGFALAGPLLALESDLGMHVDLVTTGSLNKDFLDSIKAEERLSYERQ